jgi:ribonucleoside-diphosphate reductase alpha chain
MTSNKNIPFAKSLIDYIFCWMGCQFIPGYAEKNTPNRTPVVTPVENKTNTTAKQLVQKTQDLAKKIDEAKSMQKKQPAPAAPSKPVPASVTNDRFGRVADRAVEAVTSVVSGADGTQASAMGQFNEQFNHFQDDAPACDVCGSICVRNGTCYRCFNCGNSMGCS